MCKIQNKVDLLWEQHLAKITDKECKKFFGENYISLELEKCNEEEFKSWWTSNKEIPYDEYYFDLVNIIWILQDK